MEIHDFKDGRNSVIFVDGPQSFSGGHIQALRGIHLQDFDKIPLVVSEEIR